MLIDVELTIDQRILIIKKIDPNFDILDFGIGPIDIQKWIDTNYPSVPKKATAYII